MFWSLKVLGGEAVVLGASFLWKLADGSIKFDNVVSTGSLVTASLAVIVAGIFTVRTHVAKAWKDNYFAEKERADNKEVEIGELHEKLDNEREIQRDLRHELKADISALKMKNEELERKTDLTIFRQESTDQYSAIQILLKDLTQEVTKQTGILSEILQERKKEEAS